MRLKPSFMIIGGVKCASSSMYRYLNAHPNVLPCKTKEPGYFNKSWPKMILKYRKYRQLFPDTNSPVVEAGWLDLGKDEKMVSSTFKKEINADLTYITGEATATSLVRADARKVKWLFPKMKVILLMRDPAARFVSHYNMFMRFSREGKKHFDLGDLDEFINKEIQQFKTGHQTRILEHGIYMKYIPKWKKVFGDDMVLLKSKDLKDQRSAEMTLSKVALFLNLPMFDFSEIVGSKFNTAPKRESDPKALALLNEFYAPWNKMLQEQYQIQF